MFLKKKGAMASIEARKARSMKEARRKWKERDTFQTQTDDRQTTDRQAGAQWKN